MDVGNIKTNKINKNMGILEDIKNYKYFDNKITKKSFYGFIKHCSKINKKDIQKLKMTRNKMVIELIDNGKVKI